VDCTDFCHASNPTDRRFDYGKCVADPTILCTLRMGRKAPASKCKCGGTSIKDSDGFDPGTPGCTGEFYNRSCSGVPTSTSGDWCSSATTLFETTTQLGCDVSRETKVVDCDKWCKERGSKSGTCDTQEISCYNTRSLWSGYCKCGQQQVLFRQVRPNTT